MKKHHLLRLILTGVLNVSLVLGMSVHAGELISPEFYEDSWFYDEIDFSDDFNTASVGTYEEDFDLSKWIPIEEDFLDFRAGTHREEIWHWFEDTFDLSVAKDLMYEEPDKEI